MSNLNPIAPPRFVAHATLLRLFARMAPNIQKVVSALVTSCDNNQTTLAVLIRKRKQRIQNQCAILHVLKRRWNVMLQASLFSILLLSSQGHVRAPRSCRRLNRNGGWWHLVWTSYSDRKFKQTFRVSRGTFQYILCQIRADILKQVVTEEAVSPECRWLSVCIN